MDTREDFLLSHAFYVCKYTTRKSVIIGSFMIYVKVVPSVLPTEWN
jgi:hypothetical protein